MIVDITVDDAKIVKSLMMMYNTTTGEVFSKKDLSSYEVEFKQYIQTNWNKSLWSNLPRFLTASDRTWVCTLRSDDDGNEFGIVEVLKREGKWPREGDFSFRAQIESFSFYERMHISQAIKEGYVHCEDDNWRKKND